ncbi:MAG: rhodanese-like domain-containing protein [Gammaproteobacteria bacterium]|nr:rhodanese-like domain-containing protein [Gammaproteobacteria bacterium]
MRNLFFISVCVSFLWANILCANEKTVLKIITAPEVKELSGKEGIRVINSLTSIEYSIQHIPGSINIPLDDMDENHKLPDDKNISLIFYCMGRRCLYSKKASMKAIQLGYKNVYWFEGGIPDWYRFNYPMRINKYLKSIPVKKLSPEKVAKLIGQKKVTVLDVKPEWWQANAGEAMDIENSLSLPLVSLQDTYQKIPKDRPLIIVDCLMRQSTSAARFLISKGYQVSGVLKGGITRWEKEGFPVVQRNPDIFKTAEKDFPIE